MFESVLLPAPFSPSSACTSPRAASKSTCSFATTPGKRFVIPVRRSSGGIFAPVKAARLQRQNRARRLQQLREAVILEHIAAKAQRIDFQAGAAALVERALVREQDFLPAGQEHGLEFEALGRMQRHDVDGVELRILLGVHH